jgi:hypothetical protein
MKNTFPFLADIFCTGWKRIFSIRRLTLSGEAIVVGEGTERIFATNGNVASGKNSPNKESITFYIIYY